MEKEAGDSTECHGYLALPSKPLNPDALHQSLTVLFLEYFGL
jgi:hypothetical protein